MCRKQREAKKSLESNSVSTSFHNTLVGISHRNVVLNNSKLIVECVTQVPVVNRREMTIMYSIYEVPARQIVPKLYVI